MSLMLSSSSLVCSDASAACSCASSARICSGDMLDTSWSVEPESPPELADVFAGDEVNVNMVHTQIKVSQNCSRVIGGVVNYCPPKKTGADRRSAHCAHTCGGTWRLPAGPRPLAAISMVTRD